MRPNDPDARPRTRLRTGDAFAHNPVDRCAVPCRPLWQGPGAARLFGPRRVR